MTIKKFLYPEIMSRSNIAARGQNLLSNMVLEEKLWSPCFTRLGPKGTV